MCMLECVVVIAVAGAFAVVGGEAAEGDAQSAAETPLPTGSLTSHAHSYALKLIFSHSLPLMYTNSLTHTLTYTLTHSLTHSLTYSLTHSLAH